MSTDDELAPRDLDTLLAIARRSLDAAVRSGARWRPDLDDVPIVALLPTQTRRSEDSQSFQQFSTPVPLGLAALAAARITPADVVLEPSAWTGLMAILAETLGGRLILNELAETRADLLLGVFVQLLSPVMLLVIAGFIGFIFIALVVPMMKLSSLL